MPTIDQYRDDYNAISGKASDVARQISLAGIAIIWAFKAEGVDGTELTTSAKWAAGAFVVTIALDVLQYFLGSLIWWKFISGKEKKHGPNYNGQLEHDPWLSIPQDFFFCLKIPFAITGYCILCYYYVA